MTGHMASEAYTTQWDAKSAGYTYPAMFTRKVDDCCNGAKNHACLKRKRNLTVFRQRAIAISLYRHIFMLPSTRTGNQLIIFKNDKRIARFRIGQQGKYVCYWRVNEIDWDVP